MSSSMKYSNGYWKVYVHTNKQNGKRYVGITSQKPEYRWNGGKAYAQNPHFNAAIEVYGWDGFTHEILYDHLSEEEAKQKEKELIALWKTQDREYGYNCTAGGDGLCGFVPSDELRKKWSIARTGMKRSDETKRKLAEASRRTYEASRIPLAEAKYRAVKAYTPDGQFVGLFRSIIEAGAALNLTTAQRRHITSVCTGGRKTSGGYFWQYA